MKWLNIYAELGTPAAKTKLCALRIRVDINRTRAATDTLNVKIKQSEWDATHRKVKSSVPNSNLINLKVDSRINKIQKFLLKREAFNLPINKDIIRAFFKAGDAFEDFISFAENLIKTKTLKDGQPYAEDTKRRYFDEVARLRKFRDTILFKDIDVKFLQNYNLWLHNDYLKEDGSKLAKNSIWKALSFVRMVYNEAIKDEVILPDENPFKKFSVGSYEQDPTKIKFLDVKHLDAIEDLLINQTEKLKPATINIGWRFLAMCVLGMRISDAMNLEDYKINNAGHLEFKPFKTRRHNNLALIPITNERQRRYIKLALLHPLPTRSARNYTRTFNENLQLIAAHCGINDIHITSHVGRHTMGGFLVDANVDTRPAMAILGIKSSNTLRTYAHLKQDKLTNEAEKLNDIF